MSAERDAPVKATTKEPGYYCCSICGSTRKPRKTGAVVNLEYMFQCPACHHVGPFDEFMPQDTMKYLFC